MKTGIDSFDELLFADDTGLENHPEAKLGIRHHTSVGLFGVIFGAARSGKSIFSLQLCAGFAKTPVQGLSPEEAGLPRHAVYVTHERRGLIEEKIEKHFAFVTTGFKVMNEGAGTAVWTDPEWRDSTLTIIQMPLDPQQQRHKLGYLFRLLNEAFCRKTDQVNDPKRRLLVCLDNAETISAEAFQELGVLPPTTGPAFYKRLREYCAHHRLNTWFAFEEAQVQAVFVEEPQIATDAQSYAADIVIRLGLTVFPSGYRERSFEIVKAKNQAFRRGRHHFSIRGALTRRPETPSGSGYRSGIVIYPSLPTQLHIIGRRDEPGDKTRQPFREALPARHSHKLGIDEVDEGVRPDGNTYLDAGTVSVLVSDLDSLASEIGLHFALQSNQPTLYLTTLHRQAVLGKMIQQYKKLCREKQNDMLCIMEMLPEHISESKLLKDIERWIVEEPLVQRVVLDNIYELSSKFPLLRDPKHFLTALFELFRSKEVAALVVDMVEVGEGRNPLDKSFAAGLADHVFALRHLEFQSQPSKIFSVLQLAGQHEPPQLWELTQTADRIVAEDRLEFFKGVFSGRPEPVEVTLSLYADTEDSPLDEYLQIQKTVLGQTFGHKVTMHRCHPEAYVAFQQSLAAGTIRALGDCHVISIDETWLEELIRRELLVHIPLKHFDRDLWKHKEYVTAGQDLALSFHANEKVRGMGEEANYAVPDRNNVGILAYNPNAWSNKFGEVKGGSIPVLKEWANGIFNQQGTDPEMLPWMENSYDLTWENVVDLQSRFLSLPGFKKLRLTPMTYREWEETSRFYKKTESRPECVQSMPEFGVFTFAMENRESCVSFLLELFLGVMPAKGFPVDSARRLRWNMPGTTGFFISNKGVARPSMWGDALALLLHLLSPWDLSRLSHCWFRSSVVEQPCLFSRQWFSSWGFLGLTQPGLWVMELPKGRAGVSTPVSGAWYLGILRGSTAVPAGARIIRHLTSPEEELYKLNRGIGLPVRRTLYDTAHPLEVRPNIPYRKAFANLANAQAACISTAGDAGERMKCARKVLKSRCPFYRSQIADYAHVSPLLMGMMVKAARTALKPRYQKWLWHRNSPDWVHLRTELEEIVSEARVRYLELSPE